jgi:hypothetical protein
MATRGKPFEKGSSGNPGGRPKLPEDVKHVRERAREVTDEAIDALVAVMRDKKATPAARIAAANALLDRGWGKATSTTELTGPNGGPVLIQKIERTVVDPNPQPPDS